ncbi:hypothetical protein [Mucilaginibacter ginkgonis]|uniref:Uncharacterized protein n=1 Tax=Mucilaginibacter ginkgonis TaxID=2682091 RepID=A0A6I4I0U6_9SPHI|nr:hypothetical protein [Mucilaginibacter ginkgonis]QQL48389.1 hypothetical protein GO620_009295 [Mucilaginibacter ginkgonis]
MKNLLRSSVAILVVSLSLAACSGNGSKDGSDTAKADSSVKVTADSTVKTDTVKTDTASVDTSNVKKDTISVKKTVTKTSVKKEAKS